MTTDAKALQKLNMPSNQKSCGAFIDFVSPLIRYFLLLLTTFQTGLLIYAWKTDDRGFSSSAWSALSVYMNTIGYWLVAWPREREIRRKLIDAKRCEVGDMEARERLHIYMSNVKEQEKRDAVERER